MFEDNLKSTHLPAVVQDQSPALVRRLLDRPLPIEAHHQFVPT